MSDAVAERHHSHLWRLPDGTGLHAPPGVLVVDSETGRLCCHFCGRMFRSLASHVRTHGHTADTYRADIGLCVGQPLTDGWLSAAIADRQRVRFTASDELRGQFAQGRRLSQQPRSGPREGELRPAAAARQAAARAAGRATQQARQQARIDQLVADAGFVDLSALLHARYSAGGSLDSLARETGLGRTTLRRVMDQAGIELRGRGRPLRPAVARVPTGQRRRPPSRVGTDDLAAWLRARRDAGWTLAQLGEAVGHSGHWVRWRLDAG